MLDASVVARESSGISAELHSLGRGDVTSKSRTAIRHAARRADEEVDAAVTGKTVAGAKALIYVVTTIVNTHSQFLVEPAATGAPGSARGSEARPRLTGCATFGAKWQRRRA